MLDGQLQRASTRHLQYVTGANCHNNKGHFSEEFYEHQNSEKIAQLLIAFLSFFLSFSALEQFDTSDALTGKLAGYIV